MKKLIYGIVHAFADCKDCGWSNDNYKSAVNAGRNHANKTGHTVLIDVGKLWEYNPNETKGKVDAKS